VRCGDISAEAINKHTNNTEKVALFNKGKKKNRERTPFLVGKKSFF